MLLGTGDVRGLKELAPCPFRILEDVPIDPQRRGQRRQGWVIVGGFTATVLVIVIIAIWASHRG